MIVGVMRIGLPVVVLGLGSGFEGRVLCCLALSRREEQDRYGVRIGPLLFRRNALGRPHPRSGFRAGGR